MSARTLILALALLSASPAWAASESYCVQWARSASANATTMKQVDQKMAWCINQDDDPPLVEASPAEAAPTPITRPAIHPGCRRYKSFDSRSHTFLDYSHIRRPCP